MEEPNELNETFAFKDKSGYAAFRAAIGCRKSRGSQNTFPSAAGPRPAAISGDGPLVSKGKEIHVAEKQDAGGGNIAAAANLI
ncbi:hypothetical protein NW766_001616 [Fusarium irregulare]|uniref:Uncharacterized protein n=1 Tax=Fusarium irregulare TaxID=2494466 RepID=A0A9W8UFJ9_9HYPO|nr:hypothetical protein NW766_001616 [Fusarium irregulare]